MALDKSGKESIKVTEEELLEIIQKDDIKAFDTLTSKARCGTYRLGRFPVLSLLYLYNSRKIISAYEEKFIKITAFKELHEPTGVGKLFAERAGKCLRLYMEEVVSPLEMLLILDNTKKLKKLYPQLKLSEAVKLRLRSIYSVRYSLQIKFAGNEIIIPKRPLNYREKRRIWSICLGGAIAVAIAVATPVTAVALTPKLAPGEVNKWSQIDLTSNETYTLTKNITIPKRYAGKEINCKIEGNGYKLTVSKGASLGVLNGEMRDLVIQTSGTPIFETCTVNAKLSGVTVNANVDSTVTSSTAFVALTNYGEIDNVTLNVSGRLTADVGSNAASETVVGGMVLSNAYPYNRHYGTITNCTVNYSDFKLSGVAAANATFGGIVGINTGEVRYCTVTGSITADTFDLAGVCYVNNYLISEVRNAANLTQTSSDTGWYPVLSGIAIENASTVEFCENSGNLTLAGVGPAICGGIVGRSDGLTQYCLSEGDITVTAPDVYAGGIFGISKVTFSGNTIYCGFIRHCISTNKITVTVGDGESCVGGIGGFVQEGVTMEYVYVGGGGVTDSIFMGSIVCGKGYAGSIVGLCASDVYEQNTYVSNNEEYHNFEGNYYVSNNFPPYGALAKTVEDEEGTRTEFTLLTEKDDKGVTSATAEEIEQTENYQTIMDAFGRR